MCVGTDRPALKYLNKHVKADIASKWYDIGLELFDVEDEPMLSTIESSYSGDVNKCTIEMLQLWRTLKPNASWGQVLEAFRKPNIGLDDSAVRIEGMLYEGIYV